MDSCYAGTWIKYMKKEKDYSLALLAACEEDEKAGHCDLNNE